jgi:AmmeMemoRadiSam system protein A
MLVTERRNLRVSSPPGNLAMPAGAFVTLHRRGRLRGCIGRIEPIEPLADVVAHCAAAAAEEDPRFSPLQADELVELEIEISVLSPLEAATPEEVEPGRHGLVVSKGLRRGVLLPQVAVQYMWTRERFLEETCHKGGLETDAWTHPETRIEIFTAEVFSETEFRALEAADADRVSESSDYSSSQ